jgi:polyhydroxyalkanoate synthesis regulator phasin
MGIATTLKQFTTQLSQKAMEKLFADEQRAQKVAEVIGRAQQAKKSFDNTQRTVLHQLNFATKADFKDLGKQLSALKKRVQALDAKL